MDTVYFKASDAASYTGLSVSYLAKLRMGTGPLVGPKYLRIGLRAVRYRREDLDVWMQSTQSVHTNMAGGTR